MVYQNQLSDMSCFNQVLSSVPVLVQRGIRSRGWGMSIYGQTSDFSSSVVEPVTGAMSIHKHISKVVLFGKPMSTA